MNEGKFSIENIEKATICSNEINLDQESAIIFLNEWCEQPNSIFSALNLIQVSTVLISKFICSSLIKNKISDYWIKMEKDQKENFQELLTIIIYSLDDIDDNISYNLIHSHCSIAILDWPNDYPTFSDIFNCHENENEIKITIRILSTFLVEINETKIITNKNRNNLRQLIISEYIEQFEFIIKNYLLVPEISNDVLLISNCFLQWCTIDSFFFDLNLFEQMIPLLLIESTSRNVIECLKSIFIGNNADEIILCSYFIPIIHFLSNEVCQKDKLISVDQTFIIFLMDFLKKYSNYIDCSFYYDKTNEENDYFYYSSYTLLRDHLKKEETDHEKLYSEYKLLYYFVFIATSEEMNEEVRISYQNLFENLLKFWDSLNRVREEKETIFYNSMYIDILNSIYNSLNELFEHTLEEMVQMASIIKYLYSINSDSFINFLKEQQPSLKLCWMIGSINNYAEESQKNTITSMLIELIQFSENEDSFEFLASLLFALLNCSNCFNLGNQLFTKFNQIIFDSITKNNEKLTKAAAYVFYEAINHLIGLYKNDCLTFIEKIINNGKDYLINMKEESSENLFLSCTKLIRYYKHINQTKNPQKSEELNNICQSLHIKLFEPFVFILNNIEDFEIETVETALNIIGKACVISTETANNLVDFVSPPLYQLACNSIPNINVPSKFLEIILNAIAKIQVKFDFEKVFPQIEEIMNLMKERDRVEDCFFIYFAKLRIFFKNMNDIYEQIHQQFVLPFIEYENAPSAEMFKMIEKFKFYVVDIEWFTFILIETINNLSTDVVYIAINTFINCANYSLSPDQKALFIINYAPELIKTIIKSIIDLLHKPLLLKFSELIKEFFSIANLFVENDSCDENENENKIEEEEGKEQVDPNEIINFLKNAFVSSLNELAIEPQNGFFISFVDYISKENENGIMEAFSNLLILFRKALPCDMEIFKVDTNDNFSEDDQNSDLDEQIDDISESGLDLL